MLAVKKKWLIPVGAALAVLVAAVFAYSHSWEYRRLHAKARKDWKDYAIADVARLSSDHAWVTNEIASLKAKATKEPADEEAWLSPQMILMKNGDWIAYASICSKQDSRIHDIFIGRGSDGRWYYSTFHFCRGMVVLIMEGETEGQPESLGKFAAAHSVREFDGRSDQCLQKTWPPKRR
jgi:hypothetical protein